MSDYSVFASSEFDPNDYANAILAGEPYPSSSDTKLAHAKASTALRSATQDSVTKEYISIAISKLTFGIEDITKQIKSLVIAHHEHLLLQAASASSLSGSLESVRSGLNDLDTSLEKLQQKVHVPYESLHLRVTRLRKLQQASDILRRTSRFVILARRLQLQMKEMQINGVESQGDKTSLVDDSGGLASASVYQSLDIEDEKERAVAKAALSIAEISALLDGSSNQRDTAGIQQSETLSLRSIRALAAYESFIEESRNKVHSEMEQMVITGLSTLNQTLLASSLQTAFNLGVLPELIRNILYDLSQAVEDRIKGSFDVSKISKDASAKESLANPQSPLVYRSRMRTEPTNVTAPQWTAALWARLESMFDEMADCCIKVYALEKVLRIKKDPTSLVIFLDDVMKLLENKPSAIFWLSLSRSLEKHFRDSAKGSSFLQQTLVTSYPKLLRLFHQFFGRIAIHTDTVYVDSYQSPEAVLVLHALSNIESQYLSRSTNKLNDAAGQAFSGGNRSPPGMNEGMNVARTIVNELDSAKFDPLLVRAVAKNASSSLNTIVTRVEGMMVRDRSAVSLLGPSATPQHALNAQLASFLYQLSLRLGKLESEHSAAVYKLLQPTVKNMQSLYERLVNPVQTAIQREISAILAKLHRIDFGQKESTPGGASLCMRELTEKMSFIKSEILDKYSLGDTGKNWVLSIVKFTIRNFLLHISIAKPLNEGGKLQMASDMTELEFALNSFLAENVQNKRGDSLQTIGNEYRALRAMRPLLFLDNTQLSYPESTSNLPPLIVLHHILVRSPIPLPHELHGWQEAEYVRWLDEHTDEEAWTLVDGGLSHWEKVEGTENDEAYEYVTLARTVLKNARQLRR